MRGYEDAVKRLNGLQTNSKILEALRRSNGKMNEQAIPEMKEWLRKTGYVPEDLNRLNVIHVTGTKGKGSTCAFVVSILAQVQQVFQRPRRIGLFTSPHLKAVRERIQINGEAISEEDFAKCFFIIWDRLEQYGEGDKPVYFRYLTLMAWHWFLEHNVDAAVVEVGVGGEYDSTNLIPQPVCCGITSLGLDHVAVLGNSIASIAWHKSGIFKTGVPAFTVHQSKEAMNVIAARAEERQAPLKVVEVSQDLQDMSLGLDGAVQKSNAALALALAKTYSKHMNIPVNLQIMFKGLEIARWPGRCETKVVNGIEWYLDGAHTTESIKAASEWFVTK